MAKEPMSGNISVKNRYFIMELVTMIIHFKNLSATHTRCNQWVIKNICLRSKERPKCMYTMGNISKKELTCVKYICYILNSLVNYQRILCSPQIWVPWCCPTTFQNCLVHDRSIKIECFQSWKLGLHCSKIGLIREPFVSVSTLLIYFQANIVVVHQ